MEPGFAHYRAADLPFTTEAGFTLRLIAGSLLGERSPVPVRSPMFYADLQLRTSFSLPPEHAERAAYVVEGALQVDGKAYDAGRLLVFEPDGEAVVSGNARVLLLGGASVGPRRIWWNFVSSDLERIRQAAEDWKAGRFPTVPGDPEFIPLPERGPTEVPYP